MAWLTKKLGISLTLVRHGPSVTGIPIPSVRMLMSPRSLVPGLACALAFSIVAASPAAAEEPSGPRHVEGTVDDGATAWVADVPADWGGTVILYSHGYRPSFFGIPNVA